MRDVCAVCGQIIGLGRAGENKARRIIFDLSPWISEYGMGTVSLLVRRAYEEEPYPVVVDVVDDKAVWVVTAADTTQEGFGQAELSWSVGATIVKSAVFTTHVGEVIEDADGGPWGDDIAAAQVAGTKANAVVSATARVCKGEFIQRVLEYTKTGDKLRFAQEDVHLLDAIEVGDEMVAVVFGQAEQTKLKVLAMADGAIALGNSLVVVEDEALESAHLLELADGRLAIAYNQDAAGMLAVVALDGRKATLVYTDLWDDEDPENISLCRLFDGHILLSGVRQAGIHANEAWVTVATPGASTLDVGRAIRVNDDHDVDIYANGWSLAGVDEHTAVLAYPKALDRPVGFAVIDVDSSGVPAVRLAGEGKYASSLPALQVVGLSERRWMLVYGICWLSADKKVAKSTLAMEIWGLTRYAAELIWYGCEGTRYAESIGCISAAINSRGAALTYTGDREARTALLSLIEAPYPGPAISVGAHDGFCRTVPISQARALLVSQVDGNGYVQALELIETVLPSETCVHGVAISGGDARDTIMVKVPPEQ